VHKLAGAAQSEHRARAAQNFVQISMLGKTRSRLKAVSFSRAVVIADWQPDTNLSKRRLKNGKYTKAIVGLFEGDGHKEVSPRNANGCGPERRRLGDPFEPNCGASLVVRAGLREIVFRNKHS
jgi:hypothetical protein